MATSFLPDANGSTKRPDVLSALGILTFINTGLFILIYGIGMMGMFQVQQMPLEDFEASLKEGPMKYMSADDTEMYQRFITILYNSGAALMLIYFVRTVLRLIGAIGMWRGKKKGFYLYATVQLLGIFAPHLILPWEMLGVGGPIMTVIVTAVYGSQLKRMT